MLSEGRCARALCMQHSTHPPFAPHRSHPCSNRSCMIQRGSCSKASTPIDQRRRAASHFPALKPTVSRPRQGQQLTCNLATAFSCPMPHPVWQDGRSEFDQSLRLGIWRAELSLLHRSPPTPPTRPPRPPRSRRAPITTPAGCRRRMRKPSRGRFVALNRVGRCRGPWPACWLPSAPLLGSQ